MQAHPDSLQSVATLVEFVDLFNVPSYSPSAQLPFSANKAQSSQSLDTATKGREKVGQKSSRARTGCITCRLRKKVRVLDPNPVTRRS